MTNTDYQNPPDAATIAQRLGGRPAGANDWRIPHLCGGAAPGSHIGENPGLSIGDGDDGLIVHCWYGCDTRAAYAAINDALGISRRPLLDSSRGLNRRRLRCLRCQTEGLTRQPIPGTGWPALRCECGAPYAVLLDAIVEPWTAWAEYQLADGRPRRMVRPFPNAVANPHGKGNQRVRTDNGPSAAQRD